MYARVLFPTDGGEIAREVFEYVLDLADTHDATVHILNVADTTHERLPILSSDLVEAFERRGDQILRDAATC